MVYGASFFAPRLSTPAFWVDKHHKLISVSVSRPWSADRGSEHAFFAKLPRSALVANVLLTLLYAFVHTCVYNEPMPKKRITISVDAEMFERFQAVISEVPGFSVSGVLSGLMVQMTPPLEQVLASAKEGDAEAVLRLMQFQMGGIVEKGGAEMSKLRTYLAEKEGKLA
jgi:hypothetical protein